MSPTECKSRGSQRPFKSRPDIVVPRLEVTLSNFSNPSPGLYFLAPFKNFVSTPLIFDNNGDLVWVGSDQYAGTEGPGPHVYDFHTCDFQASAHICMLRGFNDQGNARGQGIIVDSHYQPVKHVSSTGSSTSCDLHEFTTAESGTTSLVTQYRRRLYDLGRRSGERGGMLWVLEGIFQEIDLESGRVLFEWRSLDHVDPTESLVQPTRGTPTEPWDYIHLNSVEKTPDGNYLVSARHTSTILKVSGRDGGIIWRLGGHKSSFEAMDPPFLFQHHARVLNDDGNITRLSLFDNARRPAFDPERPSSGVILRIDHSSKTAHVERRYSGPEVEYTAKIAGSTVVLPNANILVGFGDASCFAEYTSDAKPCFQACLRDRSHPTLYRVYKSPWVGRPLTEVAMVSFSRSEASLTAFYVSWNGATEVSEWRIRGALHPDGPYSEVIRAPKSGFETTVTAPRHLVRAYVEGLSADGEVLGRSANVTTFVPSEATRSLCDELWCPELCAPSATSVAEVSRAKVGISGDWQRIPLLQAVILNLMVTLALILLVRFTRNRSAAMSRLARWLF
ncbi:hypothetical protein Cob_v010871 [Colletotrichum orbiculare MAFF 240422]|uniref:Arylsulfotransferase n=1 Tax=Colletotrichum orbiculare (strain 104-T / ATCC 96160 / CBS 514.97 / LARS 414 / MAFF 240422) TaxID=1213857 RepID=N4UTQ5_COLOR|nr:hypothetical protein Cob_v010871 [Colletotrichum orbiculare MAFF 240422]